jgi:hypothetical protein
LQYLTHQDVVDLRGVDLRALDGTGDGGAAELGGGFDEDDAGGSR